MSGFRFNLAIPPVVKNLIIINVLFFLGDSILGKVFGQDPVQLLGLYFFKSEYFGPWQYITHMFMHGSLTHLFFNMFALYMFGRVLEQVWGAKRFMMYYFICGFGAAALHTFMIWIDYSSMHTAFVAFQNTPSPALLSDFLSHNVPHAQDWVYSFIDSWQENPDSQMYINRSVELFEKIIAESVNVPTVGASGAVFGLLLAFGMLFPNTELMLLFPPIPIKAKYFVALYGIAEFFFAIRNSAGDNVAHVAHLGGMLFGFLLIKYWNRYGSKFY